MQAAEVAATVLVRAGMATAEQGVATIDAPTSDTRVPALHRADGTRVALNLDERPPISSVVLRPLVVSRFATPGVDPPEPSEPWFGDSSGQPPGRR